MSAAPIPSEPIPSEPIPSEPIAVWNLISFLFPTQALFIPFLGLTFGDQY